MAHQPLPHTADTGVEATAGTLAGLVEELAVGMFSLIAPVSPDEAERIVALTVEAATVEDLVVDCLTELLYRSEVDDLVFAMVMADVATTDVGMRAVLHAAGVPVWRVEPIGPPIKAVTYHGLAVEERLDGWYGRVYLDV